MFEFKILKYTKYYVDYIFLSQIIIELRLIKKWKFVFFVKFVAKKTPSSSVNFVPSAVKKNNSPPMH
jgi:hypothetical protein